MPWRMKAASSCTKASIRYIRDRKLACGRISSPRVRGSESAVIVK